jgi:hypothetical protein
MASKVSQSKRPLRWIGLAGFWVVGLWLVKPLLQDGMFFLGWQQPSFDYRELESLLKAKNWAEADLETTWAIIQITHIKDLFSISEANISRIPCADLKVMDQLWLQYSQGRFGFSVQRQIWQEVRAELSQQRSNSATNSFSGLEVMRQFRKRVGQDLNASEPEFNLQAPAGYLPSWGVFMKAPEIDIPGQFIPFSTPAFAARMDWCRL